MNLFYFDVKNTVSGMWRNGRRTGLKIRNPAKSINHLQKMCRPSVDRGLWVDL